jgi:glycerophosphoryl diester phosphodiesterase
MTTKPVHFDEKNMIAHRGASALETENSNAAFVAAGNRSYWGIETDVHRTKDGKFIIIHDDTTTRITGKELCVEETSFDELRQLRLLNVPGKTPRHDLVLPSLSEYGAICRHYEKIAVLEIKNPMEQEDIAGILTVLKAEEMLEKTVFISFCYENLLLVRRLFPEAKVQFLCSVMDKERLERMVQDRFDLDIHHSGVTPEIVAAFHGAGLKINVWTVDDPRQCEALFKMGVDYVTSNACE